MMPRTETKDHWRRYKSYTKAVVFATAFAFSQTVFSLPAAASESINFSAAQDLGAISLEIKTDECPYLYTIKPPFGRAKGRVTFTRGSMLSVEPSYPVSQNAKLLSYLNQPPIVALRFRSLPVDDDFVGHMRDFKYLKKLSLDQTDVGDGCLKSIALLSQLQELNINMTMVKGPGMKELRGLNHLVSLYCSHNNLSAGSLDMLSGLPTLEILDVSGSNVDDAALGAIGKLTKLSDLRISDNEKITDAGIVKLKNLIALKHISLVGLHVSPGALVTLGCTGLITMTLSQNPTPEQMALMHKRFPHCWIKVPKQHSKAPVELFRPLH